MGHNPRRKPARLAEKLIQIRTRLNLSQREMIQRLGFEELRQSHISAFELGTREPALPILLKYARIVGVSTDMLIDDELDLAHN